MSRTRRPTSGWACSWSSRRPGAIVGAAVAAERDMTYVKITMVVLLLFSMLVTPFIPLFNVRAKAVPAGDVWSRSEKPVGGVRV